MFHIQNKICSTANFDTIIVDVLFITFHFEFLKSSGANKQNVKKKHFYFIVASRSLRQRLGGAVLYYIDHLKTMRRCLCYFAINKFFMNNSWYYHFFPYQLK